MKRTTKRHANTEGALADRGLVGEAEAVKDVLVHDKRTNSYARTNEWGLTEKQEMFAQAVARGATLADAYRASYNAEGMATSTIYSEASKMMDRPHVADRVRHLMQVRQEKTFAVDAMRIRQHVFDRLMIESVDDDNGASARIRALELLGNIDVVQMFKPPKEKPVDDRVDPVALEAKLRATLERLVGMNAKVIEGNVSLASKQRTTTDDPREAGEEEEE